MAPAHLQEELIETDTPVTAETRYGPVRGGRAANGAAAFLGTILQVLLRASMNGL
jgi:hypothetical protein